MVCDFILLVCTMIYYDLKFYWNISWTFINYNKKNEIYKLALNLKWNINKLA